MDVGLPVGYNEQLALPQTAAHVDREPFGSPERVRSLTQLGFLLGSGASRGKTCGEVCHFVGEWAEHSQIGLGRLGRRFTRAQSPHPLRSAGNWAGNAPAHNQKSGERDQENQHEHAQKRLAPNPSALDVDVAGVVNDRQSAHNHFPLMQGERVNIDGGIAEVDENPCALALFSGLLHHRGFAREPWRQQWSDGEGVALIVVDGNSSQMFPGGKPVNRELKFFMGALLEIEIRFNFGGEAFP